MHHRCHVDHFVDPHAQPLEWRRDYLVGYPCALLGVAWLGWFFIEVKYLVNDARGIFDSDLIDSDGDLNFRC